MSTKTFHEFLQEKAREYNQDERRQLREEWVAAVDCLMAQLRAWLKDAEAAQLLDITPLTVEKAEENMGAYKVQGFRVHVGAAVVEVVPVARRVLGFVDLGGDTGIRAQGRVDVRNGG